MNVSTSERCSDVYVSEILTSLSDSGCFAVGKAQSSSENSSVSSSSCVTDAVASASARLGARKTGLSPQYFYTDRSKAVLLLWFLTVLAVCVYTLVHLLC